MDDYEAGILRGSTSQFPRIDTGYVTPGSDYMSSFRGYPKIGSVETGSHTGSTMTQKRLRYSASSDGSHKLETKQRKHDNRPEKHYSISSRVQRNSEKGFENFGNSKQRFVRDHTVPVVNNTKNSSTVAKAHTDLSYEKISPLKLSNSATYRRLSTRGSFERTKAWCPPLVSSERYNESKDKLLSGGKFKQQIRKYFNEETPWWEEISESDDDGYDTDLDKQIGFDLIADERSREVLKDGAFPEYKQECRKFRSNPNSYFLRHCLDDEMYMKHRYLSKGDSITLSNFIKNDLTFSTLDIEDNAIGPKGMKYFKEVLHENKHLTEMYLACNNLGPQGAKYLRSSLSGNCFLLKLDISENNLGDKGAKYIAGIIEDNVTMKELILAGNDIGDAGATLISKSLGNNISLKLLDLGWNNIRQIGALSLCSALKKNTELEIFLVSMNGFGEEGGKALVTALQQNSTVKEVDLSANRITDIVLKYLTRSLDEIPNLAVLNLANNNLTSKPAADFLTTVMANPNAFTEINFEGIDIAEDFKGLSNALHVVHNIKVSYSLPPSKRDVTSDILTRNLKRLCEFMEEEEIEVYDLFPDYDEDDDDDPVLITIKEALCALEFCGKITNVEKLQRLRGQLRYGRRRKFLLSELCSVYDLVICGKDPLQEQPLRTHLRRSIKQERLEQERKANAAKNRRRSIFTTNT
ncbi:leucine-rich repeat-containing protein 74A-like [Mercenaria mercenaria]|uniref:leucine-rich repeat-containing protein 74A-like n=1 Tax=Mercenaria mercenaria TaxID=6596 RepID=UPI00234EA47D|nr:leucine-rich repeat-containing protein 74A-like [Mercenaria mercenaria]